MELACPVKKAALAMDKPRRSRGTAAAQDDAEDTPDLPEVIEIEENDDDALDQVQLLWAAFAVVSQGLPCITSCKSRSASACL